VRKLTGVAGVSNLIQLKPHVEAADVKDKIMAALKRNAEIEVDAIRITVKDGTVTIDGKVKAWYARDLVEHAAWSAPGVTSVIDKVRVG
jgi:osmotically-inducible protein OsmY